MFFYGTEKRVIKDNFVGISVNEVLQNSITFNFMSTPIIKYISKKELDIWVSEVGLLDMMVLQRSGNSWMLTGRKQ